MPILRQGDGARAFCERRTAFFTTKRRRFLFWPVKQNGDVELTQHNWTSPIAPAWICRSCRKVVIDCEETL